jgi:asparagine synthase (glutamine-hydrolysing)
LQFKHKEHTIFPWKKESNFYYRGKVNFSKYNGDWQEFLYAQEGNFILYYEDDDFIIAASDVCASFSLLYSESKMIITDDETVIDYSNDEISINQKLHYRYAFGTLGANTLLEDWKFLLPGQYLFLDKSGNSISVHYYTYFGKRPQLVKSLGEILDSFITNFLWENKGNQIVLPLSGGYDSRCLAALLKLHNAQNVICLTYGKRDSAESRIAEQVAKNLDFPWHFVAYDTSLFQQYFSNEFRNYQHQSHLFHAVPYEQDYFALQYLIERGVVREPFVVMSGFGGDFISGCHYTKGKIKEMATYIVDKHYGMIEESQACVNDMHTYLAFLPNSGWNSYQQWLLENRKTKFLLSSMKAIEMLGGEWSLPFFDRDFMAFFDQLDYEDKLKQNYYIKFLFEKYFEPLQIAILKDEEDTHYDPLFSLKASLKKVIPVPILKYIKYKKAINPLNDRCNMNELYEMIWEKMPESRAQKDYNINKLQSEYILKKFIEK